MNNTENVNKDENYPILHNLKLPHKHRNKMNSGRKNTYPFKILEINDSFFVPGKTSRSFSGIINNARKKTGRTFSSLTITSEEEAKNLFPNNPEYHCPGVVVTRLT